MLEHVAAKDDVERAVLVGHIKEVDAVHRQRRVEIGGPVVQVAELLQAQLEPVLGRDVQHRKGCLEEVRSVAQEFDEQAMALERAAARAAPVVDPAVRDETLELRVAARAVDLVAAIARRADRPEHPGADPGRDQRPRHAALQFGRPLHGALVSHRRGLT